MLDIYYTYNWEGASLKDKELESQFLWLINHLNTPYKKGSEKKVCPWAIRALRQGKFHIGDARHVKGHENLSKIMDDMVEKYMNLGQFSPTNHLPDTLTVAISNDTSLNDIIELLDDYRNKFTKDGLMIGALDPYNKITSLKGGHGYPYQSPSPYFFLTIRWMVEGDILFLKWNENYKNIYHSLFS